jgi:hypothetical protein
MRLKKDKITTTNTHNFLNYKFLRSANLRIKRGREMKKYLLILAVSAILILSISTTANSVQACTLNQNSKTYNNYPLPSQVVSKEIVAAAFWNETFPVQGGWIFAVVGHEPGRGNDAWLYVSGFHPAGGPFGSSNTSFSGTNSTVKLQYMGDVLSVSATINFTVTIAATTVTYALHDVNTNWTIPDTSKISCWNHPIDKNVWSDTTANITVNLAGTHDHTEFGTSDWATLGVLNPQADITVGHWIVDSPKAGGWVFAVAGYEPGRFNGAWLYVAGYHPANAFGSNPATIFEALNTTGVQMKLSRNAITIPTLTMNFTQMTFATSTPAVSYAAHDVSVNWTITPQIKMQNHFGYNWQNCFNIDGWNPASADIAINTRGATEHNVISTSSWAIAEK